MTLLNDDERGYFMEMESLLNHPGWARLVKEMQNDIEEIPAGSFKNAKSMEDINFARGRLSVLEELVSYERILELRRTQMEQTRLNQLQEVAFFNEQTDQL